MLYIPRIDDTVVMLCFVVVWYRLILMISFRGNSPAHTIFRAQVNTLRPRQNGRHFADDIFKCIFLNENIRILIKISLNFVPKDPINNILALVQIMAWRRTGDKPLFEPMMVSLLTHICATRPQWVKQSWRMSVSSQQPSNNNVHIITTKKRVYT